MIRQSYRNSLLFPEWKCDWMRRLSPLMTHEIATMLRELNGVPDVTRCVVTDTFCGKHRVTKTVTNTRKRKHEMIVRYRANGDAHCEENYVDGVKHGRFITYCDPPYHPLYREVHTYKEGKLIVHEENDHDYFNPKRGFKHQHSVTTFDNDGNIEDIFVYRDEKMCQTFTLGK